VTATTGGPHVVHPDIERRTIKLDELNATLDGWPEATKGKRAATRGVQTKDRDTVDTYVQIVELRNRSEVLRNIRSARTVRASPLM